LTKYENVIDSHRTIEGAFLPELIGKKCFVITRNDFFWRRSYANHYSYFPKHSQAYYLKKWRKYPIKLIVVRLESISKQLGFPWINKS